MNSLKTFYDPDKKILYGRKYIPLISMDASFGQLLHFMLDRESTKILQVCDDTDIVLTGGEIKLFSIRIAQYLIEKGYQQGDVAGFVAGNTKYLAAAYFGVIFCGLPINSLDPSFDKKEIKYMFNITRPKIIFCDADVYDKVKMAIDEINLYCEIVVMNDPEIGDISIDVFVEPTGNEMEFIMPKLQDGSDQTLAIVCSSGSTGLPKGVCISHKLMVKNIIETNTGHDHIMMCFSTMYWVSGMTCLLISAVYGFKRIITRREFSPKLFFDLVEKYRITLLLTPPSQMAMIVQSPDIQNRDLSSIQQYYCGGSAVQNSVSRKMQSYLKNGIVLVGYGMTEVGGIMAIEFPLFMKQGSVGKVLASVQIKVLDDQGNTLGANEIGEICANTNTKWLGYCNNEEATKDTYDRDGWIRSGDLGYYDADGYLFVTGRIKEILKYKNYQFYPTEIESVILEMSDDVTEACVCGIPDLVATDLPAAAVIKRIGSELSENDIYQYVADKMADFKKLRGGICFLDCLPKTASGKIQRKKVQQLLEQILNKQKI